MKYRKKHILTAISLMILLNFIPFVSKTAFFESRRYGPERPFQNFSGLSPSIAFLGECDSFFIPFIYLKQVCKEPYHLRLNVTGKNTDHAYLLINSAEVGYSSGEKVVIKENDGNPIKLFFKSHPYWENGVREEGAVLKQVFHKFDKVIRKEHEDSQILEVSVSLTLMPGNITKIIEQSFQAKTFKEKWYLWDALIGI